MKRVMTALVAAALVAGLGQGGQLVWAQASSFIFRIPVMDKSAIDQLSDEELMNKYIDVEIELEAATTFYSRAGLSSKDYDLYKKVLRFRTDLLLEIQQRKLEIPQIR